MSSFFENFNLFERQLKRGKEIAHLLIHLPVGSGEPGTQSRSANDLTSIIASQGMYQQEAGIRSLSPRLNPGTLL